VSRKRTLLVFTAVAVCVGAAVAWSAAGNRDHHVTIAAPTFVPATDSTHNNAASSVCAGGFQASQPISENKGDLNTSKGSFLAPVNLPDGATIHTFSLYANDNDADEGTHVFLVRKLLMPKLSPQFNGYKVLAKTASKGAVLNTMRRFSDPSVAGGAVDNAKFDYYVEMVNCATVEPFAVDIAYGQ
jgi:hypothetical protein